MLPYPVNTTIHAGAAVVDLDADHAVTLLRPHGDNRRGLAYVERILQQR
jgi:hypothetical protein